MPVASATRTIIGNSASMQEVFTVIERVAKLRSTVLITGESGTGKELVAREIHRQSARWNGPFCPVNCGAVPTELFESELFGHTKGAFTGANGQVKGLFERANAGTLFLDEVAETPDNMQVKLFRAIQEREISPLGSSAHLKVDVRIVAASSENRLDRLRDELYYRLNVVRITLPALRNRKEDIPLLVGHFLQRFAAEAGQEEVHISDGAMSVLLDYNCPVTCGNWKTSLRAPQLSTMVHPSIAPNYGKSSNNPVAAARALMTANHPTGKRPLSIWSGGTYYEWLRKHPAKVPLPRFWA